MTGIMVSFPQSCQIAVGLILVIKLSDQLISLTVPVNSAYSLVLLHTVTTIEIQTS